MRKYRSAKLGVVAVSIIIAGGSIALYLGAGASSTKNLAISNCTPGQITVTVGHTRSQFHIEERETLTPVIFTNSGPNCFIWGTPALQVVNGPNHKSVAPAAFNLSIGMFAVRFTLHNGQSVSTTLTNSIKFMLATCKPVAADGLMVTMSPFITPTFVSVSLTVCSGLAATSTQLIHADISK